MNKWLICVKEKYYYYKFLKSFNRLKFISEYNKECEYRTSFCNEKNEKLVSICKNGDINSINEIFENVYRHADNIYDDELFVNRMSMRIIARYIMNKSHNMSIMDVACGHGEIDKYLMQKFKNISVLDSNPNRLNELRRVGIKTIESDIDNYCADEKFDIVICLESLEHVPNVHSTIEKIKSMVKKQGEIIISVPHRMDIEHENHIRIFTMEGLAHLLESHGMTIKSICLCPYLNHEKNNDIVCVIEKG